MLRRLSAPRCPPFVSRLGRFSTRLIADQTGFTLVEVVVSVVVVSTTSVALAGAMSTGYLSYQVAERDMTAVRLATDQLESTKSEPTYLAPTSSCPTLASSTYPIITTAPPGYGVSVSTCQPTGRDVNLELIAVVVTYAGNTKLSIEDYKANR